ncbi:MAG: OmpA family protein [Bacteroidota bacterium]|jgi:outer membrane protein OmpA-like peptidoglycan-associated protein|nr:OmpA family protein [Cytophagales bacterium]MCE2957113.1 OmpA family protein [Flammeovirgaceae bacterium]MCZ8070472.1 OmpA family protein [Cytophagales bacterium]
MAKMCTKVLCALCLSTTLMVAQAGTALQKGYYIVVAAYRANQETFAEKYAAELNQAGHHSQTGFDASRNFHYVYLDYFTDFDASIDKMLEVRKQAGFAEAWVRVIKEGTEPVAAQQPPTRETPPPPAKETPAAIERKPEPVQPAATTEQPKPEPIQQPALTVPATEVVPNPKADPVYVPQTLKNTQAFLSLYNATNNELIDGEVEVIDAERSRLILKAKGNEYLILPDPKSKSGKLLLIGNAFGYRKIQHEMNYYDTEKDTLQPDISLVGNYYMVRFEMARLHKGDIAVLYNVYFYNDAAIMLPESKYELNKLLTMMQENPRYKIILHGHTNGNGRGKVIRVGPSQDFFNLRADDVVSDNVSAKELSGARAQVIKDWLVSQGLAADRIDVKAWGGARMLHDKNSQHARRNVRVEVEVAEE